MSGNRSTLLHTAVMENNEKAVRFLLKHGAKVTGRETAISRAQATTSCQMNSEVREMFQRYRSSSFSKLTPNTASLSPKTNYFRCRSRSQSTANVHISPVKIHGARDQSDCHKCLTPMHVAAANGRVDILELLISYGGEVDETMDGGYTPLIIAILYQHLKAIELLVRKGANVNVKCKNGKTALYFACKVKRIEIAELLLRNGADPNGRTEHDVIPLHIAVERKLPKIVELLLKSGSNVNAKTKTGVTPLHCAVVRGQKEIAELLLSYGSDVSVIMKKGELDVTPLLWVTETEKKKITEVIYKHAVRTRKTGFYGKFVRKFWQHFSMN